MKEKLLRKLEELGLRPVDAINMLLLIMTILTAIMMVIDLNMTKRSMERELSEIRAELGIEQETIPVITDAVQLESAEVTVIPGVETISETDITNSQTTEVSNTSEDVAVQADLLEQNSKVDKIMASMSLEEKIYQLFIVTPEVLVDDYYSEVTVMDSVVSDALYNHPVGGVIFFSQDLESPQQITKLISGMQDCMGNVGMWVAVDEEGGKVARCAQKLGTTSYSAMQVYGSNGDTDEIYQVGVDIANDISQFGFNLDFAPVADVNINSGNELGDRIFSSDPQVVSSMTASIVKGLQSSGNVSATLKHFPGLGASGGNTHTNYAAYIDRTYQQLKSTEFVAFRGGIQAGADFVMVGHQIVNCAGDNLPSDLSKTVVTDWLRGDLGFRGVVVTDAHNMNTISGNYSPGDAAIKSIQAGVDIVLMPTDLDDAYNAVYNAVQNQQISESRIDESVRRILTAKEKHGLLGGQ